MTKTICKYYFWIVSIELLWAKFLFFQTALQLHLFVLFQIQSININKFSRDRKAMINLIPPVTVGHGTGLLVFVACFQS